MNIYSHEIYDKGTPQRCRLPEHNSAAGAAVNLNHVHWWFAHGTSPLHQPSPPDVGAHVPSPIISDNLFEPRQALLWHAIGCPGDYTPTISFSKQFQHENT